jgi:hypothetical protein
MIEVWTPHFGWNSDPDGDNDEYLPPWMDEGFESELDEGDE